MPDDLVEPYKQYSARISLLEEGPCKHCGREVGEHVFIADTDARGFQRIVDAFRCKGAPTRYEGSVRVRMFGGLR